MIRGSSTSSRLGVTLVELMVVSTILVLIASLTLPVSQIIRQREKENRLRAILAQIRGQGIGLGSQDDGYAEFVRSQIMFSSLAEASKSVAVGDVASRGLLFPFSPSLMENPTGYQTPPIRTDAIGTTISINIVPRRFIRKIPPNPFQEWYPNAHWEFTAATQTTGLPSPTFASAGNPIPYSPNPWDSSPNFATGVLNINSKGAGIGLDGTYTDDW